jgi:MSHA biogenesis protein MshQ
MRLFLVRLQLAAAWLLGPAAAVLWLLLSCAAPAQAATYSFRSDAYAWETATTQVSWDGSCTQYPGDDDKATISFTGGFKFRFAGVDYTSVRVLTNGMLQFGGDTGLFRDYTNDAMPVGTAPTRSGCTAAAATNVLAAYWTDLDPSRAGSGKVYWQQKGSAPNRYVVVSWSAVYQYSTTRPYSFQIVLYESGEFKYQYGSGNTTGLNATIGVQVSNTDYTQYAYNNGYTAAGTAIRWYIPSTTPAKVGEYRMDETSWNGTVGEVLDSSGGSHNGVRVGSTSQTTAAGGGYVCRAFEVPSNTTTTIAAVDTALDVDSAIGPSSGSVSLWYRANVRWNTNNNAAMLVDATTLTNRPFYLQRNDNGALRFMLSDLAGTTLVATTAAQSFAANTWVHVAATWSLKTGTNQSTIRIFVNGVQAASTTGATLGSLDVSLGTLFIGDNRSTNTPTGATDNSANGRIDEVRLYNYENTAAEIAADMVATHGCGVSLHHIEIQGDAVGLTCTPSTFTVVACQDAACSFRYSEGVTGTLTAAGATWPAGAAFSIPAGSSSVDLQMQLTTAGSTTLGASGVTPAASNALTCNLDGSSSCVYTAADSGLLFSVPHHVSETVQGFTVSAVKKADNSAACVPAFTGTRNVNFKCGYGNPASGTLPVRLSTLNASGTVTATRALNSGNSTAAACDASGQSLPLVFDATGSADMNAQYADVGQVSLTATYTGAGSDSGLTMTGSTSFIAAPASFAISGITAAPLVAGVPFSATVTARNSAGTAAPNFGRETAPEGVVLGFVKTEPTGSGTSDGVFTGSVAGFSSGAATSSNLAWSEVGKGDLTATLASGNYLGSGFTATGNTTGGAVGRFRPHHFKVTVSAGCGAFTYAGQSFTAEVRARNAGNLDTVNYDGRATTTPTYAKAVTLTDDSALGVGAFVGTSHVIALTSFSGGVATAAPAYAYTAKLTGARTLRVGAGDGEVSLAGSTEDTNPALRSTELRSGRLRLFNAFGSEKVALTLQVQAEYWSGAAWQLNSADTCTSVPSTAVATSNRRSGTGSAATWTTTATSSGPLAGGRGSITLSAPGAGNTGSVDLALNLGSGTAPDQSCLASHPSLPGAAVSWLRSQNGSCAATWDRDPSARASFGIYSPETSKTVHVREIF